MEENKEVLEAKRQVVREVIKIIYNNVYHDVQSGRPEPIIKYKAVIDIYDRFSEELKNIKNA